MAGNPWADLRQPWYAALIDDDHLVYGVARRIPHDGLVDYEVLDRRSGAWRPTTEGPGYFSGAGGITDAVPITADRADALVLMLTTSTSTDGKPSIR